MKIYLGASVLFPFTFWIIVNCLLFKFDSPTKQMDKAIIVDDLDSMKINTDTIVLFLTHPLE
jgi:hypothetical protein